MCKAMLGIALAVTTFIACDAAKADVACIDYNDYFHWIQQGETEALTAEAVLVEGGFAYLSTAADALQIYDLSDPDQPQLAGQLAGAGAPVALIGDLLVCRLAGLKVVDVSNPAAPGLLGSNSSPVTYLAAGGSLAVGTYRSGSSEYLKVFDLSNPAAPALLTLDAIVPTPTIKGVAMAGDLAFIIYEISGNAALRGIDLSDPENPLFLAPLTDGDSHYTDLALIGDRLYVVGSHDIDDGRLHVFDISAPAAPLLLGWAALQVQSPRLAVAGDRAVIVDEDLSRMTVVDISDESAPLACRPLAARFPPLAAAVSPARVYVVGRGVGFDGGWQPPWLRIADLSGLPGPEPIGELELTASGWVAMQGDIACVIGGTTLTLVDLANPADPVLLSSTAMGGRPECIEIQGSLAYLRVRVDAYTQRLCIMDLSDPATPASLGELTIAGHGGGGLDYHAGRVYLGLGEEFSGEFYPRLAVIDVVTPTAPVLENLITIGSYGIPKSVQVFADGDYLVAGGGDMGVLRFLSLADPALPQAAGAYTAPGQLITLAAEGNLLITSGSESIWTMGNGLIGLLDVSDPANVVPLATLTLATPAYEIRIGGPIPAGLFYLTGGADGLTLCSAENPDSPEILGVFNHSIRSVADAGDFLVGLEIGYRLFTFPHDCYAVTAVESAPAARLPLVAQPNPFNPTTTLHFSLAREGMARLSIHDLAGRRVRVLHEGTLPAGAQRFAWDGRDAAGRALASGVYLARLEIEAEQAGTKLLLLK